MLPDGWIEQSLKSLVGSGMISDGDWVESKDQDPNGDVKLVQLADVKDGYFINKSRRFMQKETAGDLNCTYLKQDDILIARLPDPAGRACIFPGLPQDCVTVVDVCIIRTENCNKTWLINCINSNVVRRRISALMSGGTRQRISTGELKKLKLKVPSREEQDEIALILSAWDDQIENLSSLLKVKHKQKKALMQRLLTGKHRFPEFIKSSDVTKTKYGDIPADWEYVHINHVASHVSTKNKDGRELPVLSCTKHQGLVNSAEYFGKQVYSKDLSTYKIIKKNQFAYATNHIEEGSIGYQDLHDEAVISPMYTVFKTNNKIDDNYLFKLLKTELYRHIFEVNTNASVDRRGSLRWPDFSRLYIPLPSIPEQQKIAAFLDIADKEINLLNQKLEAYQDQKKGLMQQLLTGKKRVNLTRKEAA